MKKHFMRFLSLSTLASVFFSANVFAQSQVSAASTSTQDLGKGLSGLPLHLDFSTETLTARSKKTKNVEAFSTNIYPFLGYDLSETLNAKLYTMQTLGPLASDMAVDPAPSDVRYLVYNNYVALALYGNELLTEEVNGVNLSANARYYLFTHGEKRLTNGQSGEFNGRLYLSKRFNDSFSVSNESRLYVPTFHGVRLGQGERQVNRGFVEVDPTFHVSEKVALKAGLFYDFKTLEDKGLRHTTYFEPEVEYTPNDKVSVSVALSKPVETNGDGKGLTELNEDWTLYPSATYAFNDSVSSELSFKVPLDNKGRYSVNHVNDNFTAQIDFNFSVF